MLAPVGKVHPLLSSHIKFHILFRTVLFCKQFLIWTYSYPDLDFSFTGESNIIVRGKRFKVKNIIILDLFRANTQLSELCGLLWCFYQLSGLSFWRLPFTAEDPLVNKWCNVKFQQIWWINKHIYILDGLRRSTFFSKFSCLDELYF